MDYNELIVFVIRETGWSLEYVQQMSLATLSTLVEEMKFQKAIEDYNLMSGFALIVATLASSKNRRYRVEEIIGSPPTRKDVTHGEKNIVRKGA